MSKEDDFGIAKQELAMALEEFKRHCDLSDEEEDFESEVQDLINELED